MEFESLRIAGCAPHSSSRILKPSGNSHGKEYIHQSVCSRMPLDGMSRACRNSFREQLTRDRHDRLHIQGGEAHRAPGKRPVYRKQDREHPV